MFISQEYIFLEAGSILVRRFHDYLEFFVQIFPFLLRKTFFLMLIPYSLVIDRSVLFMFVFCFDKSASEFKKGYFGWPSRALSLVSNKFYVA